MDIKYIGGAYEVVISDLQYTIGYDNVTKCKQHFLDMISKELHMLAIDMRYGKYQKIYSIKCVICQKRNLLN